MIWLLLDSSAIGGIERHVATLAAALAQQGYAAEIILYGNHGINPWLDQVRAAQLPYRILDGSPSSLIRSLRSEPPNLLHTHGYKANIIGRLVARALGIPVVSTFHAGERAPFPVNFYQLADEYTSFLGGRLCVSQSIRARMPFPATVTQNFIVTQPTPPKGALPRRIGFVGRLSLEKGPDLYCELACRYPNLGEWHVWGDGPMRAELEREYSALIHFHGVVVDLEPVWRSLGLLVMPSRAEGLPMAALEALAAGVPIAASAVGGLPGVVVEGRTGWSFTAGDLDSAGERIEQWSGLDLETQSELRQSCWASVREGFSAARHLPTIIAAYHAAGFDAKSALIPAT